MKIRLDPAFDVDLQPEPEPGADRSTYRPIQLRRFSGVQEVALPTEADVAALRAKVEAHRATRPVMPWPLPEPGTPERTAWNRAQEAWVIEKERLASELEQAEGLLRSAWRPCAPPAHALNPAQPEPTTAPPCPTRPDSKPVSDGSADPAAAPRRRRASSKPAAGASAPTLPPTPEAEAEPAPPPTVGRPRLRDTDDPNILRRREQYRRSAAKQQKARAAARSGVSR